jgi:hypothetical protein
MRHRFRTLRIAKWIGAFSCILLLLGATIPIAARSYATVSDGRTWGIFLHGAVMDLFWGDWSPPPGVYFVKDESSAIWWWPQ